MPPSGATYAVMTDGDPQALAPAARKALAAIDPTLPLDTVETYAQLMHDSLIGLIYASVLLVVDALIALLLAAIGIFGVMANLVGERTREIGVRLAMGARREDVLGLILRRASWLTGMGVGIGLLLAFGLAHGVANCFTACVPAILWFLAPSRLHCRHCIPGKLVSGTEGSTYRPHGRPAG